MNKFVQDPGLIPAREHFKTHELGRFLLKPFGSEITLGANIFKILKEIRKNGDSYVSSIYNYTMVQLTADEFEKIIVPFVESGAIKHIHLDRSAHVAT